MKIYIYILIGILIATTSCKDEKVHLYQGDTQILFRYADASINSPVDSTYILFRFAENPDVTDTIVSIPVQVTGFRAAADRSFKYEIVDSLTTAVNNEDFEIMDSYIPANQLIGYANIKLYRTEKLLNGTYKIGIKLVADEEFRTDYNMIFNPSATVYDKATKSPLVYRIFYNDIFDKPLGWILFESRFKIYFGDFSQVKYKIFLEVCKLDNDYFNFSEVAVFNERFPSAMNFLWKDMINEYLDKYEKETGERLVDENGVEVKMPK